MHDAAGRSDLGAGTDDEMGGDRRVSADCDKIFHSGRSRNAGLCSDNAVSADVHVVRHVNRIIDLGACSDRGVSHGTPINRRVGADFDIVTDDDIAELPHLQMTFRSSDKSKAVLSNLRSRMNDRLDCRLSCD